MMLKRHKDARNAENGNGTRKAGLCSFRANLVAIKLTTEVEIEVVNPFSVLVEEGVKVEVLEYIHITCARIGKVEVVTELQELISVNYPRVPRLTPVPVLSPIPNPPPRGSGCGGATFTFTGGAATCPFVTG